MLFGCKRSNRSPWLVGFHVKLVGYESSSARVQLARFCMAWSMRYELLPLWIKYVYYSCVALIVPNLLFSYVYERVICSKWFLTSFLISRHEHPTNPYYLIYRLHTGHILAFGFADYDFLFLILVLRFNAGSITCSF